MKILVVEDKFDDMEYICGILKEMRPDVPLLKAGNSARALELICSEPIDIVLTDIILPDISGFALATKIRAMEGFELLPIVFVTGSNADPLKAHRQYHCYDYISKPFTKKSFIEIMEPLLQGVERKQRLEEAAGITETREKVVFLETRQQAYVVKLNDILYAEINGRSITVYLKDQIVTDIHMMFDDFIKSIGSDDFVRCHKSYAVNIKRVASVRKLNYRLWELEFDSGSSIETNCMMSKYYREAVMEALK